MSLFLLWKYEQTDGQNNSDRVKRDNIRNEIGIHHQKDTDQQRFETGLFLAVNERNEPDASEKDPRDKAGCGQKFSPRSNGKTSSLLE